MTLPSIKNTSTSPTSYVFTYDQHGKLREEIAYDDARTPIYRKLFAYAHDSTGRESAVVAATQDGEFHHAEFSIYDTSGNLSELILLNGVETYRNVFDTVLGRLIYSGKFRDGQLFSEVKHTYDTSGHLIEIISYSPDGGRNWEKRERIRRFRAPNPNNDRDVPIRCREQMGYHL